MSKPVGNERGIALILTLLVVALLTITVVEFTYSVEVDQHMARNALSGLQASLLARSGINLGEAFLLHDDNNLVDAFTEEWCPQTDADAHSCLIDETNSQVVLPDNMRLRVQIIDEQGKFNLNLTKPQKKQDCDALRMWHKQGSDPSTATTPYESAEIVFGRLLAAQNVNPQIADTLGKYWDSICDSLYGPVGGAAPSPTVPPLLNQVPDIPTLDDAGVIGLDPGAMRRLRPVLTALPNLPGVNPCGKINLNTASRQVLETICSDVGPVDSIIAQRQGSVLTPQDIATFNSQCMPPPPAKYLGVGQIGLTSCFYLIRASALVNPNPITGLGGIGRSGSMLVRRYLAQANPLRWRLERKEWQREGGARLFQPNQEPGIDDEPTPSGG